MFNPETQGLDWETGRFESCGCFTHHTKHSPSCNQQFHSACHSLNLRETTHLGTRECLWAHSLKRYLCNQEKCKYLTPRGVSLFHHHDKPEIISLDRDRVCFPVLALPAHDCLAPRLRDLKWGSKFAGGSVWQSKHPHLPVGKWGEEEARAPQVPSRGLSVTEGLPLDPPLEVRTTSNTIHRTIQNQTHNGSHNTYPSKEASHSRK